MKIFQNTLASSAHISFAVGESKSDSRPAVLINPKVSLTKAQAKASYIWTGNYSNGKPIFRIPTRKVVSNKSAFEHKRLCDGLTFTTGVSCFFTCRFCYVESLLGRHPSVLRILKETNLHFDQVAIEREEPLPILKRQLTGRSGKNKYAASDRRMIFASPLVDVAANMPVALQTIEACRLILKHTQWQIRLLSKSALLRFVAENLTDYKDRVVFGLSTGTLQDDLAQSFEVHASTPSARLRTLHWLQNNGYRTYAMLCPILPQPDYQEFASALIKAIRLDKCEHVWAEVLNVRGRSLARTCAALQKGGFIEAANRLKMVSGPQNKQAWEDYARATFTAVSSVVPSGKLRFLQYVNPDELEWWSERKHLGAVLLGAHART